MNEYNDEKNPSDENSIDEETHRLMKDYDVDQDKAEKMQGLIDEGLDEDEAEELADEL